MSILFDCVLTDDNYSRAECTFQFPPQHVSTHNRGLPYLKYYYPYSPGGGIQGRDDHLYRSVRIPESSCTPKAFVDSY